MGYYGFIYITTNHLNGMQYIGQRKYDKAGNWKNYLGSGIYLNRAINKYGADNFSKKIIEQCKTKEELSEREKYWIKYYNATHSKEFYNIAAGGDGGNTIAGYSENELLLYKKRKQEIHRQTALKGEKAPRSKLTDVQVKEIIERLQKDEFPDDIAQSFNISRRTIDDIRNHKTWCHLTDGIIFSDISKRTKPHPKVVVQYDTEGNIINSYPSARIANEVTGINFRQISQGCTGKKKLVHGFVWRFENDPFDKYLISNEHYKSVDQYDVSGNLIQSFSTIKEANHFIGSSRIQEALDVPGKTVGGFLWVTHGTPCVI